MGGMLGLSNQGLDKGQRAKNKIRCLGLTAGRSQDKHRRCKAKL